MPNHCESTFFRHELLKIIGILLLIGTVFPLYSIAQSPNFRRPLTPQSDTTGPEPTPIRSVLAKTDTLPTKAKTDTFSLRISKDTLDAPLKYQAADSAVIQIESKRIVLYGKTQTDYKDIQLTAPKVELDQSRQLVIATNTKDSGGQVVEPAHFKSGESEFSSDTILYNFQSQVGLTKNTYSQQGEILVIGELAKKVNENTTFIQKARFTTCLLDEPHFAFVTPKMKVVNQKLAVSGPAHPEFEGVPVPVYLPFGFYPLSQGRRVFTTTIHFQ
jgi:lipopolysaccharide assembly outer membrane protein LptD (OstA)